MAEIIGFVAGSCSVIAFLPQVIKVWRTRSVQDLSLCMYVVLCIGLSLWCFYGFLTGSFAVVITNVLVLTLGLVILIMKLLWSHPEPKQSKR